jgi:hypothetical protein
MLGLILLVFAFVLAIVATFIESVPVAGTTLRFGWASLAFFYASLLFGGAHVALLH